MKPNTAKKSSVLLIIAATVFIFGFSVAFFALPDRTMSENENRVLASAPEFSFEGLFSGKLTADIKEYFSDQFPLRDTFVSIKGMTELLLGKRENNGIYYDFEHGNMIDLLKLDTDTVKANLAELAKLDSALTEKITVAIAPRKMDALHSLLPSAIPERLVNATDIRQLYDSYGFKSADLYTPLLEAGCRGDYVYYRTDHHITSEGAYLIYLSLADSLGYEPYPREFFTPETVTDEFYGTTWSASATAGAKADTITLWRYENDDEYTLHIIDTDSDINGFYDRSFLSVKDKYSVFLSGTNAGVTVTESTESDRPRLLILNDSFANSVVPFLALHFDIEIIDPRFLKNGVFDKIESGDYDEVLLLMNLDTLSSSDLLSVISVGLHK